jgi:hypothetical protein
MEHWFKKNLGDAMLAYGEQDHIEKLLSTAYLDAGSPNDLAGFIRHESNGGLHCDVNIYLSPMSATVATMIDAERCSRPSPEDLSLLVGSEDAWQVLFPALKR